jgi:hypothetical protein
MIIPVPLRESENNHEHIAVAWITPAEIPDYDLCAANKDINERITKEYQQL